MKKTLTIIMALCLVMGIAGISYASVDSIYEVAVIDVSGDVKVDAKADGTWITPWVGMKLMQNALIKTGPDSSVSIVFDAEGLNILRLDANTQLTVEESLANVTEGTVTGDFSNLTKGSTFSVKTPTAVCAVRGTVFRVQLASGGELRVELVNGNMTVQGLDSRGNLVGSPVSLPQASQVNVSRGGSVSQPTALTAAQISQIESAAATILGTTTETVESVTVDDVDGKDLDGVKDEEGKEDISPSGSSY